MPWTYSDDSAFSAISIAEIHGLNETERIPGLTKREYIATQVSPAFIKIFPGDVRAAAEKSIHYADALVWFLNAELREAKEEMEKNDEDQKKKS